MKLYVGVQACRDKCPHCALSPDDGNLAQLIFGEEK